jgi:RNA-directed DNA polymerase
MMRVGLFKAIHVKTPASQHRRLLLTSRKLLQRGLVLSVDRARRLLALHRRLEGPAMCASDVTATLDQALATSGLDHIKVRQRPRLLSDNGSSYVADDLAAWLKGKDMQHVRGAPYHPQTRGKIERWHQTLKNRILLNNYYLPGDLERQITAFVEHYNHVRYHEGINNLTPADVYFGRDKMILAERQRIKRETIANRRLQHRLQAA